MQERGGDEFVAILERGSADVVARRLGTRLAIEVEGIGPVSASIGVAAGPYGANPRALLRLADKQMYSRKARGPLRHGVSPDAG